jgi:HEAT repeat protein
VTAPRRDLIASPAEQSRLDRLRVLLESGPAGIVELLAMRTDPSWAVRRAVIAALAQLGEPALEPLGLSLRDERDDETRIAATVDALVASTGDVDTQLARLRANADADAALLADVGQILGRRRNPASVPALAELATHENDNVAVAAIEGLGRVGGRAVVDVLVQAVSSDRFFRTFAAIDVLGKSQDPRAVPPLAALLEVPHYSDAAARALGHTCDRAAVAPLAQLLSSPVDSIVRVTASALAELRQTHAERFGTGTPIEAALQRSAAGTATRRLVQSISGADVSEQVAINVVLGCLGNNPAAAPALLRSLDGPPAVARAAADALERLSNDSEDQLVVALWEGNAARRQALLPTMRSGTATDAIVACLTDADGSVRRLACEALARIGSRRAVPDLFESLADASPGVVQAATSAIVSLGYEQTPVLAAAAARSAVPAVRRAAMRILSHLGSALALELLESSVGDPDPRVRDAAILGLSMVELPRAAELLLELSRHESPQTRAVAIRALGESSWRDARVSERLAESLQDADAWVRYYACQACGKLKLDGHVEQLARLVSDPAGQVRVAALEALSHLPGDRAFETLLDAAQTDELDLRRTALIGLGLSRRGEALGVLLANVSTEDAATRLITLSALAKLDEPETLAALTRAARDPDESVRIAALGFIGERNGVEATEILAGFVTDPVLGAPARALLSVPHRHRVAGLSAALGNANDEQAVLLTGLLARLNQPDATAALFEAVTLPNGAARRAAVTTLGALGSSEALTLLQRLSVEDPDAEVRRVCALLLAG